MFRIASVLIAGLGLGAALAWSWSVWPFLPGILGAAVIIFSAGVARRVWNRAGAVGSEEPGPYERRAWHSMASISVVSSHLAVSLCSGLDLHVGQGNSLAVDNWLLLLGAAIGWLILRPQSMDRDERDADMANRGAHVGYRVLVGLLIVLLLVLGFAPFPATEALTLFVLGNLLVVLILISGLAAFAVQLAGYWAASRPEATDG